MIRISESCIKLIKEFEGLVLKPYHGEHDPPKVFTIGYGTTKYPPEYMGGKWVALNDPAISEIQADSFLMYDVKNKAALIDPFLRDDLSDNQFAAMISFAYNLGENALKTSTLLRKVEANPRDTSIRTEFERWVHDEHGNKVPGLIRRRAAEANLYFTV